MTMTNTVFTLQDVEPIAQSIIKGKEEYVYTDEHADCIYGDQSSLTPMCLIGRSRC